MAGRPPRIDRESQALRDAYRRAWERIEAEQAKIADDPARWRRRARLSEMSRTISQRLSDLHDVAEDWIKESLPRLYSQGARASAASTGIGFAFTEIHQEAVRELAGGLTDDLLKATRQVNASTKVLIRQVLKDEALNAAIAGGTAQQARKAAKEVLERFGIHAVTYSNGARVGLGSYADMALRTVSALAYNRGTLNGNREVEFWECFDGFGCGLRTHNDPDLASGLVLPRDQALAYPIAHPNAIMQGTRVTPIGTLQAIYRARWLGPVLRIRSTRSSWLTVGPNHPILTNRGWVKAKFLRPGDEILHRTREVVRRTAVSPDFESENVPPAVEEVFDFYRPTGSAASRVAAPEDFHGDGNFCQGEVDVVAVDGQLRNHRYSLSTKKMLQLQTEPATARLRTLTRLGNPNPMFESHLFSAHSSMSGFAIGRVLDSGADANAALDEATADGFVGNADLLSKVLHALAGQVAVDQVVEIRWDDASVWAFDLETSSGCYLADGIVVHNCQRSWGPRPDIRSARAAKQASSSTTAEQREGVRLQALQREEQARTRARTRAIQRRRAARNPLARRERILSRRRERVERLPAVPDVDDPRLAARIDRVAADALRNEPGITSAIQQIERNSSGELVGLHNRLKVDPAKGVDRLARAKRRMRQKVVEDVVEGGFTAEEALAKISDSVRYTLRYSRDSYVEGVRRVRIAMANRFEEVRWKNFWGGDDYQGITGVYRDRASGQLFELQFHTPESLSAKSSGHPLYEISRDSTRKAEERHRASRRMMNLWRAVRQRRPPGSEDL